MQQNIINTGIADIAAKQLLLFRVLHDIPRRSYQTVYLLAGEVQDINDISHTVLL